MTNQTQIIDTKKNVETLIVKIKNIVKKSIGQAKTLWKDFLKDCRSFVRKETKRLAQKWNALRFAAEGAENLHMLLSTATGKNKEIALTILETHWQGYLIWIEKTFKNKDYSNRAYMGGSCWTGKYYEVDRILDRKTIKKLGLLFKKAFFPDAKISVKMEYKEYLVKYKRDEDREAAKSLSEFYNEFGFDFSNSMVDYFFRGYDSDYMMA